MNRQLPHAKASIAVQRCDRFVGRTMNWLYDHLRFVPRHKPLILCDQLQNRQEFPEMTARLFTESKVARAIWRRITGTYVDPFALHRLHRDRPQVLHSHFGYVAVGDYGLWKWLNVPWVIGFYGADVYAHNRHDYAEVFQACSRALALGPAMARQLERLGCPTDKIVIHPLGVDVTRLPEVPRQWGSGEHLKVLFAGTFTEKKGVEYSLKAIAAARRAALPIEFHLVAEGSDRPGDRKTELAAHQLIEDLNLEDIVVRHSFLTFRDLLNLALRCHVFLAPSVTAADGDAEGTPFVLQQMMATAMPVIATHHSDIPFLFGDLSHLLVPERDSQAIADRLIEYARNPRLLTEHGHLGRGRILKSFDVRDCASKLSDIYDALR